MFPLFFVVCVSYWGNRREFLNLQKVVAAKLKQRAPHFLGQMFVAHTFEERWAILCYLQAYQDTVQQVLHPHLLSAFQFLSWFPPNQVHVPNSALGRASAWLSHPPDPALPATNQPLSLQHNLVPVEPRTCCSQQLKWSCTSSGVPGLDLECAHAENPSICSEHTGDTWRETTVMTGRPWGSGITILFHL